MGIVSYLPDFNRDRALAYFVRAVEISQYSQPSFVLNLVNFTENSNERIELLQRAADATLDIDVFERLLDEFERGHTTDYISDSLLLYTKALTMYPYRLSLWLRLYNFGFVANSCLLKPDGRIDDGHAIYKNLVSNGLKLFPRCAPSKLHTDQSIPLK